MSRLLSSRVRRLGVVAAVLVAPVVAPVVLAPPASAAPTYVVTGTVGVVPVPAVTAVAPTSGLLSGGRSVTITGTGLTGATAVHFGATAASFTVDSDTQVTATSPARATGDVDVTVTTAGGTSAVGAADVFTSVGTYGVTRTIAVGAGPAGVDVDASTHDVYVGNFAGNTVSVIDGTTGALSATIPVGSSPNGLAVDSATHTAYVADYNGNAVTVIDGTTNTVTATVPVGAFPGGVAVDPTTHRVYVANIGGSSVSVIDGTTHAVTATIPVDGQPTGVAVDPSTHTVYVTHYSGVTLSVIDGTTNTVTARIVVGRSPGGVAVDPATHTVFVANQSDNSVSVIDGSSDTVTATVPLAGAPYAVTVDAATHAVLVADVGGNTLSVLDGTTHTVTATVPVGQDPSGVAIDPATHLAYVANSGSAAVSVVSAGLAPTVTAVAPTSGLPAGGGSVTITGTDLTGATGVAFGSTAATSYTVDSPTQVTAVAPAGAVGAVDVTVTTPFGTSAVSAADQYTYATATPGITTTPSAGTVAGGSISDTATLTGGASPSSTVTFTLFGPDDTSCTGTPVSTQTIALEGGSASSGAVVVTVAGTYRWTAAYAGDVDNDPVSTTCGDDTTVTAAALDHLVLSPATATVAAGGSQAYTAEGFDAYGNSRGDLTASARFSVAAPRGGHPSCTGAVCTATVAAHYTVTAAVGGVRGTAPLVVVPAPLDHLTMLFTKTAVAGGATKTYGVKAYDAYGNLRGVVTAGSRFSVSAGASCDGAVCGSQTAGQYTVTATYRGRTTTGLLLVVPAATDHIVVGSLTGAITAGGSKTYVVRAYDVYGNSRGIVTGRSTFQPASGAQCNGSTCTAAAPGQYSIEVTYLDGGQTATVVLRVNRKAPGGTTRPAV